VCVSDENSRIQQYQEQLAAVSSHHPFTAINTYLSRNVGPYRRNQVSGLVPGKFVLQSVCVIGYDMQLMKEARKETVVRSFIPKSLLIYFYNIIYFSSKNYL
jgi:hypothetical protein